MASASAQLPLIIEIETLQDILADRPENLVIVDLGKAERFHEQHIPTAKLVTPAQTQRGAPIPGLIPATEDLQALIQRLGIDRETTIVIYDDEGGGWAGRFIWILDELGHSNYSYVNGGLTAWNDAGLETESGEEQASLRKDNPRPTVLNNAHTVELQALVDQVREQSVTVWDARSRGEYTGEKANSKRGGRIPGACHYEWTEAMDKQRALRLKPEALLREELALAGIDGSRPIVTHCQSHHRSGLTYLIGKLLGFEIKAYAGSWGEWGNHDETPVETGNN